MLRVVFPMRVISLSISTLSPPSPRTVPGVAAQLHGRIVRGHAPLPHRGWSRKLNSRTRVANCCPEQWSRNWPRLPPWRRPGPPRLEARSSRDRGELLHHQRPRRGDVGAGLLRQDHRIKDYRVLQGEIASLVLDTRGRR